MAFEISGLTQYLLVFARLASCFMINPIFSRNSIPTMFRMMLVLLLTFIVAPNVSNVGLENLNMAAYLGLVVKEVMIGATLGFVIQIFVYMLTFAGDSMDTAFGLAMAKVMNPATDVQNGAAGNILTYLFMLILFVSNSHLVMIRAFIYTFECIELSAFVDIASICSFIFSTFISAFDLGIRLFIPYVACELILEITLGVLMKMIPQIHVFVINIQLKIIVGLLMLLMLSGPLSSFMDLYVNETITALQEAVISLSVDS
ncbi:MAG: flagellar biosynthetic protein FliR [Erysipelotrichales bacterium]|nr:flagellar biosynthetic protein FliR [Erysipelotrichales bacterium]